MTGIGSAAAVSGTAMDEYIARPPAMPISTSSYKVTPGGGVNSAFSSPGGIGEGAGVIPGMA